MVVQDWFTDMSLLRFLQTAEMLKPSTPPSQHDGSGNNDDQPDYYPHLGTLKFKIKVSTKINRTKTLQI